MTATNVQDGSSPHDGAAEGSKRLSGRWARFSPGQLFARFGLLLFLIALVAITAARKPGFLTGENLFNILKQWSWTGVVAVGMTMVIVAGGIDLSVGALMAFLGGLGIVTLNAFVQAETILAAPLDAPDAPIFLSRWIAALADGLGLQGNETVGTMMAFVVMLSVGGLAGWLHGALIARGRLAPFIATLGGLAAYRSLVLAMARGGEIRSTSGSVYPALGQGGIPIPATDVTPRTEKIDPLLLPYPVLVFIVIAIAGWIVLTRTRLGRYVYAVGCNERAARYAAVDVVRVKTLTYVLLGVCTGLAAILISSRLNAVSSSGTGILFELDVIAAVVIGGTSLRGGSGTIGGTLIGVLVLGIIDNILGFENISPYLHGFVKGVIIVLAAFLQRRP